MVKRARGYVCAGTVGEAGWRWLAQVRRRVRPRPWLALQPGRCALLVVDMVRYFGAAEGRAFLPAAAAILPTIGRLLEWWRRTGAGPVVFTRHGHLEGAELGMLGRFFSDHIRFGEPDSELLPDLAPLPGELVLRKDTYDAFHGTALEPWLRERGATQVAIAGVLTQMCCETTARSAFVRNFETFLFADATATFGEQEHLRSLNSMADCVAVVLHSEEVAVQCPRS